MVQPEINYKIIGDGPETIVMLHGWRSSLNALYPMGELLALKYKVVLLDLPGFGKSPLPSEATNAGGGWSTIDYLTRIREFLNEIQVNRFILLGHSFGGRISIRFSESIPDNVTA